LFEVEPVGKRQPQARPAAVDKRFRAFDPHQVLLLPPSLDDWLPKDHLARFVADLVDKVLDLGQVRADYTGKRGYPPYDPRLMLRLLIYGYTTGVRSSRAIEQRCPDDIAFRFLAADQAPGFRSISRFRRHLTPSPPCSPSPCTSHRSSAWSRWAASPWTAPSSKQTPPSTRR
jgi:transposase